MRILFEYRPSVLYNPDAVACGAESVGYAYVSSLQELGYDITAYVRNSDIPISTIEMRRWYVDMAISAQKYDVTIINSGLSSILIDHLHLFKKPTIIIDYQPITSKESLDYRRILINKAQSAGSIVLTPGENDQWYSGQLIDHVVPIDRAPLLPVDDKLITVVGRNTTGKNLDMAAAALRILEQYGYKSVVFTTSGKISHPDVRYGVSHAEIMKYVAKSYCLLQPSSLELNGSCVAFEAASHGTPVIYGVKSADYFLKPTGVGTRLEFVSADTLVNAVLNLRPGNRQEIRDWFDKNYSKEQFVSRLVKWLDVAISQNVINNENTE